MASQECTDGIARYGGTSFFQFFSDSTFTLTRYRVVSKYHYNVSKKISKGKYLNIADTLFLSDSSSLGYPFIKDTSIFKQLGKDESLQLYPAKIILVKSTDRYPIKGTYLSFLNIPRQLKGIDYICIVNLQMDYDRALLHNKW